MRWTATKHGNYNMVHWREDGRDAFKIIPRHAGAGYSLGYSHYVKLDEETMRSLKQEIRALLVYVGQ